MRRDAGFTLVEMLASLVVLAMVSLLILQGIGTSAPVWRKLERNTASGTTVESAQTLLRDRLEHAYPAVRYDGPAPYVDFAGGQGALAFLAPPRTADAGAALARYSLRLSAGGDLLLSGRDSLALEPRAADTVLLSHVQAIDLAYFGAGDGAPPRWRDRWTGQGAAPLLVRLRLTFQPGDRRFWPELIVRPAANADLRCVIDPATGGCESST